MASYSNKEKTITCPYNKAHQIRPERIQYHLVKCREHHPKVDHVICPYNATHHVPRPEEQYHISTCGDRKIVEMAKYSWLYDKPGQQGNLTNPVPNSANIPVEVQEGKTTDKNHNQQGVKGFGDVRGPLRRPALGAGASALPTLVEDRSKSGNAATDAADSFQQDYASSTRAPLRRPGQVAFGGQFPN